MYTKAMVTNLSGFVDRRGGEKEMFPCKQQARAYRLHDPVLNRSWPSTRPQPRSSSNFISTEQTWLHQNYQKFCGRGQSIHFPAFNFPVVSQLCNDAGYIRDSIYLFSPFLKIQGPSEQQEPTGVCQGNLAGDCLIHFFLSEQYVFG